MNSVTLTEQLQQATESHDFYSAALKIEELLKAKGVGLESVRTILEFMEAHPDFDFGTPGPLIHYIETFPRREYEPELLLSLARRPMPYTLWLLNRLINVTKDIAARKELIEVLRQVESHPEADAQTKWSAADFLEYQTS